MTPPLHAPRGSPPDKLEFECARILPRLTLIPEFNLWIRAAWRMHGLNGKRQSNCRLLWDCFAFGAPLCTLLELIGTPPDPAASLDIDRDNMEIEFVDREKFVSSFIRRVQLLEIQDRIPYGEVLRSHDLFNGGFAGFAKVLRTVNRVLTALQESYPGLFVLPRVSHTKRREIIQDLLDSERAHVNCISRMVHVEMAAILSDQNYTLDKAILQCFSEICTRLLHYHEHILDHLEKSQELNEEWDEIFAFDSSPNPALSKAAIAACKSYCVNIHTVSKFLESLFDTTLAPHARFLLDLISAPLCRLLEYQCLLQSILDLTSPTESQTYDSLCSSLFTVRKVSQDIDEIGMQVRTMWSTRLLKARAYLWNGVDPDQLGLLLLDDCMVAEGEVEQLQFSLFLFETMLLCCQEATEVRSETEGSVTVAHHPIYPWELGPALSRNNALNTRYTIPTDKLKSVRWLDQDCFELHWADEDEIRVIVFKPNSLPQCDQWCSMLQLFVPPITRPPTVSSPSKELMHMLSEDELRGGRGKMHPKPWSVIARKGARSESSSLMHSDSDYEFPLSPNLLPFLFNPPLDAAQRSRSPLAINTAVSPQMQDKEKDKDKDVDPCDMLPTPPDDQTPSSGSSISTLPLDLTGKIVREGSFPAAHGGFADVWKCVWNNGSNERKVAVKVLRSRFDGPQVEGKMSKRLRRELRVWQKLDHENVLQLYGTASDFGPYTSMVCPWMENGSVSKYLERCGDILSVSDRLQLLSEVAAGLSYLHSFGVVHGDLSGSNILITDEGKACLCDFGLSSILAEFQGNSRVTSLVGGAVRWAPPELYRLQDDGHLVASTQCDIYSFGSVVLEILSGRIPYHYIRTDAQVVIELHKGVKPRRPASAFVTDTQWKFIERCWENDPEKRPDIEEVSKCVKAFHCASLKRRHTA